MKRLIDNLLNLVWIGKLVKNGVLTSGQARFLEGAIYTFQLGLLTYIFNVLNTFDFSQWKPTLIVLSTGFAKTIIEGIMKIIRDKNKETPLNPLV